MRTEYEGLRFWYLHELSRLRASARAGHPTKTERKAIIKTMVLIRKKEGR